MAGHHTPDQNAKQALIKSPASKRFLQRKTLRGRSGQFTDITNFRVS